MGAITYHGEEDNPSHSYLVRTYGLEQFGLPELATYMSDQADADAVFHALLNVGLYMVEGGSSLQISSGMTADFRGRTYLFTQPQEDRAGVHKPYGGFSVGGGLGTPQWPSCLSPTNTNAAPRSFATTRG